MGIKRGYFLMTFLCFSLVLTGRANAGYEYRGIVAFGAAYAISTNYAVVGFLSYGSSQTAVGIRERVTRERLDLFLSQPHPNPSRGRVEIEYTLPWDCDVRINIYDATGRKVKELISKREKSGKHRVFWDLKNDRGKKVKTGIYFIHLVCMGKSLTKRVLVLMP